MAPCPSLNDWHQTVPRSTRTLTALGVGVLVVGALGFGIWASIAPLDGAVVATGSFVATGQNKQIQHLEGGIVGKVMVNEGDVVRAGQILLRLDGTAVETKVRRLTLRWYRLLAQRAALEAELAMKEVPEVPVALRFVASDPEVQAILTRQRTELSARIAKTAGEQEVLRKEIAGLEESIAGYEKQAAATEQRIRLFAEELEDKSHLLDRELVRKTEVLSLQRAEAGLSGELGELTGRIADARERIARANQQIMQVRSAAVEGAVQELRQTEGEIDDVAEQIRAAQDVAERMDVRAPVDGIVVKLNQHTTGGVISPGGSILELVPVNEDLVIEARVSPSDITHVSNGQGALVRLSSLNQRSVPMIDGKVVYVSADAVSEGAARAGAGANSARDSFVVRVKLDSADTKAKIRSFQPTPGMPADIYIRTGQRTFFEYIMRPVFDSFSRAFRES